MIPIHLALSGSGFKFPAHVGALQAVREAGYQPTTLAGTSGGSIVAALLATGMSLDDMKTLCLTHDWSDMLVMNLLSIIETKGYCDGTNLLNWVTTNTKSMTFADLPNDLIVMASDVKNEVSYEFSKTATPNTLVAYAVRASASIPFLYDAVTRDHALLMDGGMCNNIPVDKLPNTPDVMRLGIQLVSNAASEANMSMLTTVEHVVNLILNSNDAAHVEIGELTGAHIVFIETGYASSLDRDMNPNIRQRLYMDGYNKTKAFFATL